MSLAFISYRRTDAAGHAGRLGDRLRACFGEDSVFRDHEAIRAGSEFDAEIRAALRHCAVFIAVIGPGWLEARGEDDRRRLDDPDDYVRQEIEHALDASLLLVPVCVGGASLPAAAELPESLRPLLRRQAVELREARWDDDVTALLGQIQQQTGLAAHCPELRQRPVAADALRHFVPDLLALHTRPVDFLLRHNSGQPRALHYALAHTALAILLCEALAYGGLGWRRDDGLLRAVTGAGSSVLLALLLALLAAASIWLAWRVTGVRGHFQHVLVNTLYHTGLGGVLYVLAGVVVATGLTLNSPDVLQRAFETLKQAAGGEGAARVMAELAGSAHGPAPFVATAIGVLILLDLTVWLLRAWRGHRAVLRQSRWRARAAEVVLLLQCLLIIGLPVWLGIAA